ncbi:hypothetical protein, partial [Klebsiella pneumoniae]|uniref:hypothetical protein n=1 Tax=Klebsiella pneumoniae TaxID=573 RepID=UPI0034D2B2FA
QQAQENTNKTSLRTDAAEPETQERDSKKSVKTRRKKGEVSPDEYISSGFAPIFPDSCISSKIMPLMLMNWL